MTQENQGTSFAVPDNLLPVKRKRGRPRKDRSQTPGGHVSSAATPTPVTEMKNQRRRIDPPLVADKKNDMVGQAVFGVLDGSFDAGYLLTVRVGDTDTILKGVVFQPGSSVPISGSNDVAPQIKMLKRAAEIHVDLPTTHVPTSKEAANQVPPIVPPQSSTSQPQITNDNFVTEAAASNVEEDKTKNSAEEDVGKSLPNNILPKDTIGHVDTPVRPESELKNTAFATDGETIRQETKAPSLSETEPCTKVMLDQGQAGIPVDDDCDHGGFCTTHDMTTTGPTTELVQENQPSKTDQLGEMLRHEEAIPHSEAAAHE